MIKKILITVTFTILLSGCVRPYYFNNQTVGVIAGGLAGGIISSQILHGRNHRAGIVAGTIIGGLIGQAVGQSFDYRNRQRVFITNQPYYKAYYDNGYLCKHTKTIITYSNGVQHKSLITTCFIKKDPWHKRVTKVIVTSYN